MLVSPEFNYTLLRTANQYAFKLRTDDVPISIGSITADGPGSDKTRSDGWTSSIEGDPQVTDPISPDDLSGSVGSVTADGSDSDDGWTSSIQDVPQVHKPMSPDDDDEDVEEESEEEKKKRFFENNVRLFGTDAAKLSVKERDAIIKALKLQLTPDDLTNQSKFDKLKDKDRENLIVFVQKKVVANFFDTIKTDPHRRAAFADHIKEYQHPPLTEVEIQTFKKTNEQVKSRLFDKMTPRTLRALIDVQNTIDSV